MQLADLSPYHAFEPRPTNLADRDEQASFCFDTTSKFAVCLGGNGSGKTHAAAWKTARLVRETPPHRPACPFWIVGELMEQVCKVAWVEKLAKMIPAEWILHVDWYRSRRNWPRAVILRDRRRGRPSEPGWVLEFKSYEQGIDAFKAASIGGYWCNEEVPLEIVHEIQGRCREYDSPGWADFTPIAVKSPEWPEVYQKPPDGWRFYHLNTMKNETLTIEWRERYLGQFPPDIRQIRQYGDFGRVLGAVFPEFSHHFHVVEPYEIPADWKRIRGIDFGYSNPFCCLWVAKDHDDRYVIYDEHYDKQQLLEKHATEILKRPWSEWHPHGPTYSDHAATERAELAEHGISTTLADKEIRPSIEYLRTLMMPAGDGRPRLTVFRTCENLIREIPGYRWPSGSTVRNPAETPLDRDNHAIDAMRYAIYTDYVRSGAADAVGWRQQVDPKRHGVQFERSRAWRP
jgi:hypothetical protein